MGLYINPPWETKESWLEREAIEVAGANAAACWLSDDVLPICLVNNGPFTAAAVAYNTRELSVLNNPRDLREKRWFVVEVEKIRSVCREERIDLYLNQVGKNRTE